MQQIGHCHLGSYDEKITKFSRRPVPDFERAVQRPQMWIVWQTSISFDQREIEMRAQVTRDGRLPDTRTAADDETPICHLAIIAQEQVSDCMILMPESFSV